MKRFNQFQILLELIFANMSSTNRHNAKARHISDYYVTPQNHILNFLNNWMLDLQKNILDDVLKIGDRPDIAMWLDPCAGGDKHNEMSYPAALKEAFGVDTDTIDIRDDSLADIKEDFISMEFSDKEKYDVVITNPPFNKAIEIIKKSLEVTKEGGYVVMLLRLNFFGSKARKEFWDEQMPMWTYVHHRRMSFTDDGKTDSIEYMHAVFVKGQNPDFTILKVI